MGLLSKTKHAFSNFKNKTTGLLGKAKHYTTEFIDNHSGLIGKGLNLAGNLFLNEDQRNAVSNIANGAISMIPDGAVKSAFSRVNDIAQRKPLTSHSNDNDNNMYKRTVPNKFTTKDKKQLKLLKQQKKIMGKNNYNASNTVIVKAPGIYGGDVRRV